MGKTFAKQKSCLKRIFRQGTGESRGAFGETEKISDTICKSKDFSIREGMERQKRGSCIL